MTLNTPSFSELLKNPIHALAFGFGSGLAPKAPGTFGTLMAIPFYLLMLDFSVELYSAVLLLSFIAGVYICDRSAHALDVHDHPGIVWDEMVGYWLTMFMAPVGWQWMLAGFLLFRLFDIAKPWPIGWLDKKVGGGFGIMIDDVLAAIYALILLQLVAYFI